ncbi:hypothetical protein CSPAE12_05044 [Colletotrichum incanum]|nr:hypothetical protein CSPAE12_05044 [Colletotrichum incanum]
MCQYTKLQVLRTQNETQMDVFSGRLLRTLL